MPRQRTGTVVKTRDGRWQGVITLNDGTRLRLNPFPAGTTKREAKRRTAEVSADAQRRNLVHAVAAEAVAVAPVEHKPDPAMSSWVKSWHEARERRGIASVRHSSAHWRVHIRPVLGHRHVASWTAADLRALVAALDAKVAAGAISWKTAQNAWATATRMCRDAYGSKVDALRCRDDNPAPGVEGPDRGARKSKAFLYPSEVVTFVGAADVPLLWRHMVAVATYLYLRAGELRALAWSAVDLEHAMVHVHQAHDSERDRIKPTKGKAARRVPIEPALLPLLRLMRDKCDGDGLVFPELPHPNNLSASLRRHLLAAGVDRAELHERRPTTKRITFHDLRASGITWLAVRGDAPLAIQQRAGHTEFKTTEGYIRQAEALRSGFGEPFPELPESIAQSFAESIAPSTLRSFACDSRRLWCEGGDLNPSGLAPDQGAMEPNTPAFPVSGVHTTPAGLKPGQGVIDSPAVQRAAARLAADMQRAIASGNMEAALALQAALAELLAPAAGGKASAG